MFSVNNRNKNCLHRSAANLPHFQKVMYYADIKIFVIFPLVSKVLHIQVKIRSSIRKIPAYTT